MKRVRPAKEKMKELRLDEKDFGFSCADVSNAGSYKRHAGYNLSVTNLLPFQLQIKAVR